MGEASRGRLEEATEARIAEHVALGRLGFRGEKGGVGGASPTLRFVVEDGDGVGAGGMGNGGAELVGE